MGRSERSLRKAQRLETIRLEALRNRLLDPKLGPIWWIEHQVQGVLLRQDPDIEIRVKSSLSAFDTIHKYLIDHEARSLEDDRLWLRKQLDDLFAQLTTPEDLAHIAHLIDTMLQIFGADDKLRHNVQVKLDDQNPED